MASLKFHEGTTLKDIQRAFGGPGKFALRATDGEVLRGHGKRAWSVDDLLARFGVAAARERIEQSGERAMGLIQRAIDNEFGRGMGAQAFERSQEKKHGQAVSLADLRSAAEEVAPQLALRKMGTSFIRMLTEAVDACGFDRARLIDYAPEFAQGMAKAVLDLEVPPQRELHRVDFQRAAQGALLAMLFRRMAEESGGQPIAAGRLATLEAGMASFFEPGARHAKVELGAAYRALAEECGFGVVAG